MGKLNRHLFRIHIALEAPSVGGWLRVGLHMLTLIRMLSQACPVPLCRGHTHNVDSILASEGAIGRLALANDDKMLIPGPAPDIGGILASLFIGC